MRQAQLLIVVLCAGVVAGCQGGSSGPTCSFDDAAVMARSTWPKFRHDERNTGTVDSSAVYTGLATNPGMLRWVFPPFDETSKGPFPASPSLNADESHLYIGSSDSTLYGLLTATGTRDTNFAFAALSGITSTALLAVRDGQDAIFVGSNDSHIYGLNATGQVLQNTDWPFSFPGFVSASPTFANDGSGTIYGGSGNGFVFGLCPNGVSRWGVSITSTQSSPAIGADGSVIFGADDHQLRALRGDGNFRWAFSTAGAVTTAVVIDAPSANAQESAIYVADRTGRVFKVDNNGQPDKAFAAATVGPISSSPALVGNHLIFGSDDGNVYASDKHTGQETWTFATNAPVQSSPAVVIAAGMPPVLAVGSNDGTVYFLQDNGTSAINYGSFVIGAPIHSSPAVDQHGTVYVGADDGRVYAIGSPLATPTATPTVVGPTPTPTAL